MIHLQTLSTGDIVITKVYFPEGQQPGSQVSWTVIGFRQRKIILCFAGADSTKFTQKGWCQNSNLEENVFCWWWILQIIRHIFETWEPSQFLFIWISLFCLILSVFQSIITKNLIVNIEYKLQNKPQTHIVFLFCPLKASPTAAAQKLLSLGKQDIMRCCCLDKFLTCQLSHSNNKICDITISEY